MPDLQVINITPHKLMTTREIVRDLANFKIYKKECTPHADVFFRVISHLQYISKMFPVRCQIEIY